MSEIIILVNSENLDEEYQAKIDAIDALGKVTIIAGNAIRDFALAIAHCCGPVSVYSCGMPASYGWMLNEAISPAPVDYEREILCFPIVEECSDPKVHCTKPYQERAKPARLHSNNFNRSGFRCSGKLARGRI